MHEYDSSDDPGSYRMTMKHVRNIQPTMNGSEMFFGGKKKYDLSWNVSWWADVQEIIWRLGDDFTHVE